MMTARDTVKRLLEDDFDPDDPSSFLASYRDAFEQLGFVLTTRSGEPAWAWSDGRNRVEVTRYTPENAGDLDVSYEEAEQAGATGGGYEVWATQDGIGRKVPAYAVVTTEQEALEAAARFQKLP